MCQISGTSLFSTYKYLLFVSTETKNISYLNSFRVIFLVCKSDFLDCNLNPVSHIVNFRIGKYEIYFLEVLVIVFTFILGTL